MLWILSLSLTAQADCYGGHEGDPAHEAVFPYENLGTDWVLQITEPMLGDLWTRTLARLVDSSWLRWQDDFALGPIDIRYDMRATRSDLLLQGDAVELGFETTGWTSVAGIPCPIAGELGITAVPTVQHLSGEPWLVLEHSEVRMPDLCVGSAIGAAYSSAISGTVEPAIEALVDSHAAWPVADLLPMDPAMVEALPGFRNPLDELRLSVVDTPLDGGPAFLSLGGSLLDAESCHDPAYPLYDPDAFDSFTARLGSHDASLAVSTRGADLLFEEYEDGITDMMAFDAGFAYVTLHDHTVFYTGLDKAEIPCACTTGDTEAWLDIDESDPRLGYRLFFYVWLPDIWFWNPGPVTLQINGSATPIIDSVGSPGVDIDLSRANAYGPWWADTAVTIIKWIGGPDLQDAGYYQDLLDPYLPYAYPLAGLLDSDAGSLSACATDSGLAQQALSFRYTWDPPPDVPEACGADVVDGRLDEPRPDSDGDGIPDEWEIHTDPNAADTDDDGLADDVEAILGCDPTAADTDGDGAGDWSEGVRLDTACDDPDTDGDGATDGCEDELGLDPHTTDSDGDGELDGDEDAVALGCP